MRSISHGEQFAHRRTVSDCARSRGPHTSVHREDREDEEDRGQSQRPQTPKRTGTHSRRRRRLFRHLLQRSLHPRFRRLFVAAGGFRRHDDHALHGYDGRHSRSASVDALRRADPRGLPAHLRRALRSRRPPRPVGHPCASSFGIHTAYDLRLRRHRQCSQSDRRRGRPFVGLLHHGESDFRRRLHAERHHAPDEHSGSGDGRIAASCTTSSADDPRCSSETAARC